MPVDLPPLAPPLIPALVAQYRDVWPQMRRPVLLAAQVEQETCISLTSKGCWNPHTELKTSREYGFGLGQTTITSRFNAFTEVQGMDRTLRNWKFENRFDATLQLRALMVKDALGCWKYLHTAAATYDDGYAFTFACYNGGLGGVISDQKVCAATPGCDPARWWGNVERTSNKRKTAVAGYGQSFFAINRAYPKNIMQVRWQKYQVLVDREIAATVQCDVDGCN